MAAPILSKKQKAACLSNSVGKTKSIKLKHVLCGENINRPKPSRDVEESIVLKLSEIFKRIPNIFKSIKNSSTKDQEAKRKVRVQLDLGTNCVCRSLEKNRLACVLVSGKVTPATAVDHVITLAKQRGCPLLCLDSLSQALARVTKSKSLPVCIGFKKLTSGTDLSDFVDVISLVQQNTTTTKRLLSVKKNADKSKKKDVQTTLLPASLRPVALDNSTSEAVREDLKRIFANAAFKEGETKMMTSKEKKKKKNKKKKVKQYYRKWLHNQFESGKKTVTEFVGLGKMRLVLIIPELVPVLMSEQSSNSLLCVARDQDCPVLCVSDLSMVMSADSAKVLAVLGIKKESCLPPNTQPAFSSVIEKCVHFMRSAPMPTQDMDVEDDGHMMTAVEPIRMQKEEDEEEEQDYSFLYVMKKDSTELKERALKLKQEQDNVSKQMTFASDFISFGSSGGNSNNDYDSEEVNESASLLGKRKSKKPLSSVLHQAKKMNLDTQKTQANISGNTSTGFISFGNTDSTVESKSNTSGKSSNTGATSSTNFSQKSTNNNESENTSLFSISRAGDLPNTKDVMRMEEGEEASSAASSTTILGLDPSATLAKTSLLDKEGEHVFNLFSAASKKGKGEDKKRHNQDGFVSFAYTEANIHTMVNNSDRQNSKKKKKGGKK